MTVEASFFLFLLERYAAVRGYTGGDVMRTLDEKGLTDFVYSMYEMYHQEAIENAFADLDSLIATGQPAW